MKTRPPAVANEPPRLGEPYSAAFEPARRASAGTFPSGASQRTSPVERSTAVNRPQGGATQGTPLGDSNGSRYIAYGVPVCLANSPLKRFVAPDSRIFEYSSRGISLTRNGRLFVLTKTRLRVGSED